MLHSAVGREKRHLFVMCHGFRGSMNGGGRATQMAELAAGAGYTTVRFNFTPVEPLTNQTEELEDVLAYCRREFGRPFIGMGRSMGGCALAHCALTAEDIRGLCFWSMPGDLVHTFRLVLADRYDELCTSGVIEVEDEYGHCTLHRDFLDDLAQYDMPKIVRRIAPRPAFFIHGTADAIVPIAEAKENYRQYRGEKEWHEVEGADHHLALDAEASQKKILRWMERYFSE